MSKYQKILNFGHRIADFPQTLSDLDIGNEQLTKAVWGTSFNFVNTEYLGEVDGETTQFIDISKHFDAITQLCLFTDVSSKEIAEIPNIKEHVNLLASLGRMTVNIAHELTQPVSAIRLLAENSLDESDSVNWLDSLIESRKNLLRIVDVADALSKYVDQLKTFARRDVLNMSPTSVAEILQSVQTIVEPKRKECNAILVLDSDNISVSANTNYVNAILINLVCNAFDAVKGTSRREVRVTARHLDDMVRFTVRDFGPGLSSATLANLFNSFQTTKVSTKSLGIGLQLSKDIAQQMGAKLQGTNHPEGGAVFSLDLKITD
jgi:C4-dicarboxylate-specific signal transduction histidine kinase